MSSHELLFVEDLHGFLRGTQPEGLVHQREWGGIEGFFELDMAVAVQLRRGPRCQLGRDVWQRAQEVPLHLGKTGQRLLFGRTMCAVPGLAHAAFPPPLASKSEQADAIRVYKAQRKMDLLRDGKVIRTYRIVLGGAPVGHKRQQGDGRTPEGDYTISYRNAQSRFHLSLRVSYPNEADRRQARARGVDPGGDIMIHGQPNKIPPDVVLQNDWTAGCIALSNAEIAEVFAATKAGTEVEITP